MTSEHSLLGEVHYQQLDNGRVRCIETGHEMPEAHAKDYAFTKKCKAVLFDKALADGKGAFKFFEQSTTAKDKVACKLTGVILNKTEEALWKHMTGKKFTRAMDEKEVGSTTESAKPQGSSEDAASIAIADRDHGGEVNGKAKRKSKKKKNTADGQEDSTAEIRENLNSEDQCFWVPPVGERWDNDDGGDRWRAAAGVRQVIQRGVEDMSESEEEANSATDVMNGDVEMREGTQSPEDAMEDLSLKRTAMAVGPSSFAGKKKKRKGGR